MFSYYGSKSKIIHLYPSPRHQLIIEPFAGSARYALKYYWHDVLLVDKYPVIIKVWNYLQQASEKDILGLPEMELGQSVNDFSLSEGEKALMGFMVSRGNETPKLTRQSFSNIAADKKRIAANLHKIRHWEIKLGDYRHIDNVSATWFVDPPYQHGGEYYHHSEIDRAYLAEYCKSRLGQVIVCENTKADWLDFYPMREMTGQLHKTVEAIWCNHHHDFAGRQLSMFGGCLTTALNRPPTARVSGGSEQKSPANETVAS